MEALVKATGEIVEVTMECDNSTDFKKATFRTKNGLCYRYDDIELTFDKIKARAFPEGVFGMKWFKNLFKKRNVKLGFTMATAGTDIEGRHSVCFQEVNDVWCICVYKCEVINGLHYFNSDERKLVCAIPLKGIVNLALAKKSLMEE